MALVLIAVVFALLLILSLTPGPFMAGWPPPLRVLATACVQVGLMSYVLRLCLTPYMARFIHPNSKTP
jgi:antibiotic biosynthesis monooxygenase (ABM) superfamily enzyme